MIDIELIRNQTELVSENNKNRGFNIDMNSILALDASRRLLQTRFDALRAEQKNISKSKPDVPTLETLKKLKNELKNTEGEMKEIEEKLRELLITVPNIIHESVPIGGEKDGREIRRKGEPKEFHFTTLSHEHLGIKLNIIDVERGAKISGNRFWYIKGKAVLLQFALQKYVFDILLKNKFLPMMPPHLVRENVLFGAGFLPASKFEIYNVNPDEDDLYLIGTSEAPLVSYHSEEIIDVKQPIRYCALTPCYRREAGAYGKDTTGIIRGHQFDKIEMVSITKPEESWNEHEKLLAIEEEIISGLELPYRIIELASGDMSQQAAKCYDIEVFMPGQNKYREVTSCSNTTDFQARRLNIRYRNEENKLEFVHTLNGTAIATGRILVAIIENYQLEDCHIQIPNVLKKYLDFELL